MAKALTKVFAGLILLALGIWSIWLWRFDVLVLIRGSIGIFVALLGIIFLAIAKE